jgi:hypothetical protein
VIRKPRPPRITGRGFIQAARSSTSVCCQSFNHSRAGPSFFALIPGLVYVSRMRRRRSISAKMLVSVVASMLLCCMVVSEFPELLSLADNASNDFSIRASDSAPILSVANQTPIAVDMRDSESGTHLCRAGTFGCAQPSSSESFDLHSVLRR